MKTSLGTHSVLCVLLSVFGSLLPALSSAGEPGETTNPPQEADVPEQPADWVGKFSDGTPLTRQKLDEMLAAHKVWTQRNWKTLMQHLYEPLPPDRETGTGRLILKSANLEGANLEWANLLYANLEGANLLYANLEGADLRGANLKSANLEGANLEVAHLEHANLEWADLRGADLENAYLQQANLERAIYEPRPGRLPNLYGLINANNLEKMQFVDFPPGLVELRKVVKEAGYREAARKITYAIRQSEQEELWQREKYIDYLFNDFFFDLPVGYGLYPKRALGILVFLIPMFAVLYIILAFGMPTQRNGIYRIWPRERIEVTKDGAVLVDETKIQRLDPALLLGIWYGLYFSLLSAFHIGFRELNVGDWISRLQRHPYTLQATGWVRTVAGLQSLISVYLLALCVLTYFGTPFDE
jgi:uncharacterized protein YjbI with pentapeptide repeats